MAGKLKPIGKRTLISQIEHLSSKPRQSKAQLIKYLGFGKCPDGRLSGWLSDCRLIPFVKIDQNKEGIQFGIDWDLRAICDLHQPRPRLVGRQGSFFITHTPMINDNPVVI